MKVVLYSTHCPQCDVLEVLLKEHNINYDTVTDIDEMRRKGFLSVPKVEVDGIAMTMKETMDWLKERN